MMDGVRVHVVHAFEHEGAGGNPAGVVLDADDLSPAQKQAVAARVGLSETAFVSASRVADFKLEFFTPTRQIAHCGHATVAAFSYLRQAGRLGEGRSSKETIDGCRAIRIEGDLAFMQQQAPAYFIPHKVDAQVTRERIAASLGLTPAALHPHHPPLEVSTGNAFLLVALRSSALMDAIEPDLREIEAVGNALGLIGYYVWVEGTGEFAASTRMFAPGYGIPEESATGMAAGPLACYLSDRCSLEGSEFVIEQGAWMQPPSRSRIVTRLEFEDDRIVRLFAGGRARYGRAIDVPLALPA